MSRLRRSHRLVGLLVLLAAFIPAVLAAETATPLVTRAGLHDGFARLVFAAPNGGKAVAFTATIDDHTLTLQFKHPVAPGLAPVRDALGLYIHDISVSADGLTVTAHLNRPVVARQSASDEATYIVDLVDHAEPASPPSNQPVPVAEPEKPAPKPRPDAVAVPIHVTAKKEYDRLAFDWPKPATATIAEAGTVGTITFDRPGRFNLDALNRALPAALRPAHLTEDGQGIVFTLPADRHLRSSQDGKQTLLDVLAAQPAAAPNKPAAAPAKAAATAPVALPPPAVAPKPQPGAQDPGKPDAAKAAPPPDAAQAAPPPDAAKPTAPPDAAKPAVLAAPPKPTAPLGPPSLLAGGQDAIPVPPSDAGATTASGDSVQGNVASSAENGLKIQYSVVDDGLSVRFDWVEPTAAVIFRRNAGVWIVFDRTQNLCFADFQSANWPVVTAIAQQPSSSGTVLRLSVWSGYNATVRRAGTAWIVTFKGQTQRAEEPVNPVVRHVGNALSMFYPVNDPSAQINFVDPEVGDTLVTFPLRELGQGLDNNLEYPDFRALATAEGLVFRPLVDALTIHTVPGGVEVTAPGGLTLSSDSDRAAVARHSAPARLFQPQLWIQPPGMDYTQQKQALLQAIAGSNEAARPAARLALARFYVANGFGFEALGPLRTVEKETPTVMEDPANRALRGIAEVLGNERESAAADLGDHRLDDSMDVQLWRRVLAADQGKSADAMAQLADAKEAYKTYPPQLRRRVDIRLAEAAIDTGDNLTAGTLAADVLTCDPAPSEADLAKVIQGRIAVVNGDSKHALDLWAEAANSPHGDLARAEARYAIVMQKLQDQTIPRSEAISELDRLRFAWRGDAFEARVLHKLAELYFADGDYRNGFPMLRRIISNFPDDPLSAGIANEMQQYFVDLFLGKAAENVPALKALGYYEEFKELTPAGAQGDAIIRKLADRLVSLDAFDRADTLLETQVKTRLTGLDQARVATQLSVVRLLDQRPDAAIAALDLPVSGDLPVDLQRQRQELRARALAELNKPDDALKILADDDSRDADRVRLDIYRRTQNWAALSQLMIQKLRDPDASGSLPPDAAKAVINATAALILAKDHAGIDALQKRFGAAMAKTQYKDDFLAIAGNGIPNGASFQNVVDRFSQIGDLQSFMSEYRQRIAQDKLSAIN